MNSDRCWQYKYNVFIIIQPPNEVVEKSCTRYNVYSFKADIKEHQILKFPTFL